MDEAMKSGRDAIANVVGSIVSASLHNSRQVDGDYERDGLRYCGVCGKPKTMRIRILDNDMTVGVMCDCQTAVRDSERAKDEAAARERRRAIALPNEAYRAMTFGNSDCALNVAERYVRGWKRMLGENIGLLLYGGVGSGKTYMAAAVANELVDMSVPVYMDNMASLVARLRDTYGGGHEDTLRKVRDCDLFVLDDFGVEAGTDYSMQLVYELVETRFAVKKPMIATTNLTPSSMKVTGNVMLERLYSRLSALHPVAVTGVDRRKKESVARYNEINALLGL